MHRFVKESTPLPPMTRRRFVSSLTAGLGLSCWGVSSWRSTEGGGAENATAPFQLRYLLSSSLYGYTDLREILPEVRKTGAEAIDLWPKPHGSQREQIDDLGEEAFRKLLENHGVRLGALSRYDLGPFGLSDELRLAQRLGCEVIITGAGGPRGLTGDELRQAVKNFVEKVKPTLEVAETCSVTVAIENHSGTLLDSPDAVRWLAEFAPPRLGIAFAPYHLPQDAELLAHLVREVGHKIAVFYFWQYGKGCLAPMPLEDELLQLPGRGPLDFRPILAALREVGYRGYSEIFMHPYPRGRLIHPTIAETTAEINRARDYLTQCLAGVEPASSRG